jgi:pimeloyl-ACP methyl ester carboxylesterase
MKIISTKDVTQPYYKDWGPEQSVVFCHGWPLSSNSWEGQLNTDFQVFLKLDKLVGVIQ